MLVKQKKIPKQITSWSWSRYSEYEQCPFKAKQNHILRIKEPTSPPMLRGSEIHDIAKDYIIGKHKRVPKELKNYAQLFKDIRELHKHDWAHTTVEQTWAFTKNWAETEWNDWNNCWLRVKVDFSWYDVGKRNLEIYDWKTGKFRLQESKMVYTQQLELYALAGFHFYPCDTIEAVLVYLDAGEIFPLKFTRKQDFPRLQKTWAKRIRPMLNDTKFAPRANDRCRWCFYRKENKANGGGQCKF